MVSPGSMNIVLSGSDTIPKLQKINRQRLDLSQEYLVKEVEKKVVDKKRRVEESFAERRVETEKERDGFRRNQDNREKEKKENPGGENIRQQVEKTGVHIDIKV